ncbi:hypothetical protein CDL15_Pgr002565 [Punica granatum]|uniref:Uncharacterized protein n=1 Tax=Punica granatum TaxID=22663 RepID=A0A218WJN3_PUNGR|nr:hypothetical protein CDL15_Pgr010270 [Punica granatum]OWM80124.1 hypothetical protein CDL15_Pgr002565 [Punica granatum]
MARCKVGLVGLLRGRSRRSWKVPNVPKLRQTQNSEIKLGKSQADPVKEKRVRRRLCTVDRPSDRDHLFTREGEGCEEPFERDGTTRQSRGTKWHAWKVRCAPGIGQGTRFFVLLKRGMGGFKSKI